MNQLFFLTVIGFLYLVQPGETNLEDVRKEVDGMAVEMKRFIEDEVPRFQHGLEEVAERLRIAVAGDDDKKGIVDTYIAAHKQLNTLPAHCAVEAQMKLVHKLPDFFNCPNLTLFKNDMNYLVFGGVNLTRYLLDTAVDFFHGFTLCTSWLPWKLIPCYVEKTWKLFTDFRTSMRLLNDYVFSFVGHAKDLVSQFEYCKQRYPNLFMIEEIMRPAYECAKSSK